MLRGPLTPYIFNIHTHSFHLLKESSATLNFFRMAFTSSIDRVICVIIYDLFVKNDTKTHAIFKIQTYTNLLKEKN